jgi:hypothetical protein
LLRAGGDDVPARGIRTRLTEPAHALDVGVAEDGKHPVMAGGGRIGRLSHGFDRTAPVVHFEGISGSVRE